MFWQEATLNFPSLKLVNYSRIIEIPLNFAFFHIPVSTVYLHMENEYSLFVVTAAVIIVKFLLDQLQQYLKYFIRLILLDFLQRSQIIYEQKNNTENCNHAN
jgi:hypothetical protein